MSLNTCSKTKPRPSGTAKVLQELSISVVFGSIGDFVSKSVSKAAWSLLAVFKNFGGMPIIN